MRRGRCSSARSRTPSWRQRSAARPSTSRCGPSTRSASTSWSRSTASTTTPLHDELEPFEGVQDLLAELLAEGRRLGIVTAKRRKTIELAFGVLDLERHFDAVVDGRRHATHKPDPEPVREALARLDAQPDEAAFVGDSPFDMGAGKAAGVFTVGVGWGGLHQEDALREAGADAIVHSFEELRGVL